MLPMNFIPLFPLDIVVFPGEELNLHIFEPKYKQLINECMAEKKSFGIPVVTQKGLEELGTLMDVVEIVKVYEDGKMDVKTRASDVFRILEFIKTIPDKLYYGAIVNYPENNMKPKALLALKVLAKVRKLHTVLHLDKKFSKPDSELNSYDMAHHAGLSQEEEYELLGLFREDQRLEYLKRHLKKVLPVASEMEALKEKIKMNGHFKNLGSNFNI
jgi:uncharacterized protein